ncbi:probable WRKY transcription factor 51 [Solanum dulcamara]|uniref:probable WRKY transcription factor 51 n=1 Tax=Solanum dulcamara TaxID=45834 RepID=UPI0024855A1C|nr:probable WRKY transcription factor 51 [Solanum dulcamara]
MNSNFLETSAFPQTGNPNFTFPLLHSHLMTQDYSYNFEDFESSSFLDQLLVDYSPTNNNTCLLENHSHMMTQEYSYNGSSAHSFYATPPNIKHLKEKSKVGIIKKEIKKNERHVIAFRTETQLEILNDGYKWRKYGKKKVKSNNIYLRNYYKCSIQGCVVKKKVERDGHDSSYLITTYEGRHNHEVNSSHLQPRIHDLN